ncbi:MAG: hypothetical protein E1N59_297 [Puniceicoccaceae bacterium 5H]|nr:MAG: hypothetical protein E1N59_297 [Puniceicoccaceae bacterium 5H]
MTKPLYVILGSNEADRATLLDFLLRSGWEPTEKVTVWSEPESLEALEHALAEQADTVALSRGELGLPAATPSQAAFLLPPLADDPRDWLETIREWEVEHDLELAKIITVMDLLALHDHPQLRQWYDACLHFSDVLLLSHRDRVEKKWVSDLERDLQRRAYPFLVATLKKKGSVEHPQELLFPEARRLSQYFDEPEPEEAPEEYMGIEIVDETPAEVAAEIEEEEAEEANEPKPGDAATDAYLARFDYGQRKIKVPLIPQIMESINPA